MLGYSFRHSPFSLSSFSLLLSPFSLLLSPFSFLLSPFPFRPPPFSFLAFSFLLSLSLSPFAPFLRHARDSLATIHDVSTVRARPILSKVIRFWGALTTRRREDRAAAASGRRFPGAGTGLAESANPSTVPHCTARCIRMYVLSLHACDSGDGAMLLFVSGAPTVARLGAVPLTARGPLPASRPI